MPFIHDDFLLSGDSARRLYHEYAKALPIIDYHCHLPAAEIANDQRWDNLGEVWLAADHYKWRAMRSNGIDETRITGNAPWRDKFTAFAGTMDYCLRNPLYHWSALELKRYFGIDTLLSAKTADEIYATTAEIIRGERFSARQLMQKSNVVLACTTDDPIDSLEHHAAIAADDSLDVQALPTFRPDKAMAADNSAAFLPWIEALEELCPGRIETFDALLAALDARHEFFHSLGCRLSDHGMVTVEFDPAGSPATLDSVVRKGRNGEGNAISHVDLIQFRSALLIELGRMNHKRGWTQQYHFGCLRNTNSRRFAIAGADAGFDSIADPVNTAALSRLLDAQDRTDELPRTILYNLNPSENYAMATMIGNFQQGPDAGKIQLGSGWWFCDQLDGMRQQLDALSQLGLLRRFVGMLTDSRSFLSYPRHEYFRRLLCEILGREIDAGLLPADFGLIGATVRDISYNNAARYFGFDLPQI
jgi:glucuronate isomerase